jgi:hypothetical protein
LPAAVVVVPAAPLIFLRLVVEAVLEDLEQEQVYP